MANREAAVVAMTDYLAVLVKEGVPVKRISRHLLGLFQGEPGAKRWRRYISEHAHIETANDQLLMQAMEAMREESRAVG